MKMADRIISLKPSATLAVSAKAQELKASGKHVLTLSVGEPDFSTPEHICAAAKKAIDEGFTRYTPVPGIPELRAAVAGYFASQYGVKSAKAENVIITNGGKQSLFNIFFTLLDPGDHVLIPAPYWVSYPPMVELAQATPVIIETKASKGFKVSPSVLDKYITPKTRALLLNSPSNPTGACYTREELAAIAKWAISKNIVVIADEIYDRLVYQGIEAVSFSSWWEKYPEHFIVVNGVAKSFAMTGWRVGYTLASEACIRGMSRLQGQSTSNVCSIAQKAALAALTGDFSALEQMRKSFERRRDIAMEHIKTWPDVTYPRPDGAFYLFIDIHNHYTPEYADSSSFCTMLLEKEGVAVVPGIAFGNDQCIRLSFAVSEEDLVTGLDLIKKVLLK